MQKIICSLAILTACVSCTFNVSMAHTQGTATDTIDDNATADPTVSPNVNIPLSPGAGIGLGK